MDVPKFYNPVVSLLLPPDEKGSWLGMKTTGQLKRERGIQCEPLKDSLYTVCILAINSAILVIFLSTELFQFYWFSIVACCASQESSETYSNS